MERVYLDHNATSSLRPRVARLWRELSAEGLGNPSSLHASGRRARAVIDDARAAIAAALDVHEEEIYFTSGGTEANNIAVQSARQKGVLLTTPIEHAAVLEVADMLSKRGKAVKRLTVSRDGRINPDQVAFLMETSAVDLVALSIANNEIGTVQPIADLRHYFESAECRPLLFIDAVQALGRIELDFKDALRHVDMASFSMHKLGGPMGVGVLYARRGTPVRPLAFGGGHEEGLRPGTENAAAIAAAALAVTLAIEALPKEQARTRALTRAMWDYLNTGEHDLELLGPGFDEPEARLGNTLAVLARGRDARMLVTRLDQEGVELSAGSDCSSGAIEPSHVLAALGIEGEDARSGLRISVGWNTSGADCKRGVEAIGKVFSSTHATCNNGEDL